MPQITFEISINNIRKAIKELAKDVLLSKVIIVQTPQNDNENREEVVANLMLCYRHLEDASMRLGKVLQARDGGVSVYDKESAVGA